jgi:hypothetical protein
VQLQQHEILLKRRTVQLLLMVMAVRVGLKGWVVQAGAQGGGGGQT